MNTCATCHHWKQYKARPDAMIYTILKDLKPPVQSEMWGQCLLAENPRDQEAKMQVDGNSLDTAPDFGCNQHQEKAKE